MARADSEPGPPAAPPESRPRWQVLPGAAPGAGCPARLALSMRARAALLIFQMRHNGFNNGKIGLSAKALSKALGDQNHKATGRAIAELIEHGFLECTSNASRSLARVREYRISFIPTGDGKGSNRATHDYTEWRPGPETKRKFGGAINAPREGATVTLNAPKWKFPVTLNAPCSMESRGLEQSCCGASIAPHILYQSPDSLQGPASPAVIGKNMDPHCGGPSLDELRGWSRAVIDRLGYGGGRRLAEAAGIPEPALSRFRSGRNLPDHFRGALHKACAHALAWSEFKATLPAEIAT